MGHHKTEIKNFWRWDKLYEVYREIGFNKSFNGVNDSSHCVCSDLSSASLVHHQNPVQT